VGEVGDLRVGLVLGRVACGRGLRPGDLGGSLELITLSICLFRPKINSLYYFLCLHSLS
jgi:hypothetical protein